MMLNVENLHAAYGRIPVLQGASLAVGGAEIVGILGHNGMGKTTLLRALIGHLPARSGRIGFSGIDITRMPPHQRARMGLGYVPQGRQIFPALTVRDNLRMGCSGGGRAEAAKIDEMVAEFPRLAALLGRAGGALSGGEQQILALARSLCATPSLLLLDEPTEGIQPSIVEEIIIILQGLHAKRGLSILVVEQNLDFIARLSQRVLLIEKGSIRAEMSPADVTHGQIMDVMAGMAA